MSEALLTILRWCLLALVYLFFFRVLQATWSGSTTTVAVRRVTGGRRSAKAQRQQHQHQTQPAPFVVPHLMVLQPAEMAGARIDVAGEMTIGRAVGCQIVLDDGFLSQRHARFAPAGDGVVIEDLGSTNGTYVNQQRITTPVVGQPGDRVQMGGVVMELRR